MVNKSRGEKIFRALNGTFFIIYALLCILPIIHILSLSLSSSIAVSSGKVGIIPVDFTLKSYEYILQKSEFWAAMFVSFKRVFLGVTFGMTITILAAYPLSKSKSTFRAQGIFAWGFIFTMLFNGGMIPTYMIVRYTGMLDKIWALVIPCGVQVFNIILLMNFFRHVPKELEESACIDGAGHWRIMLSIYLPVSLPAIATLVVFTVVFHWNQWFDGLIYMNKSSNYPMQTYLQSILVQTNVKLITKAHAELMRKISDRTIKSSQVFIAAIPVLMVYPFLQKYFIAGIMLGSVKE